MCIYIHSVGILTLALLTTVSGGWPFRMKNQSIYLEGMNERMQRVNVLTLSSVLWTF